MSGTKEGARKQRELYGEHWFKDIAAQGGAVSKQRTNYHEIGKKGGDTTLARHGVEHFKRAREAQRKKQPE